jgi:hypothetical protein
MISKIQNLFGLLKYGLQIILQRFYASYAIIKEYVLQIQQ